MLLWRYMTVDTWRLFERDPRLGLSRIAGFDDAFECSLPLLAATHRARAGDAPANSELTRLFNLGAEQRRKWASCWFADEHESIAMWQLHVGRGVPGVAVAVLHADLLAATPNAATTAPVHYIRPDDHSAEAAIDRPDLWPLVKAWGYRHEREVRLVVPEAHGDVEISEPSARWARLRSVDLRSMLRRCRVFDPNSASEVDVRRQVEAWAPGVDVTPSRAYPVVYQGVWRYGMDPGHNWTSQLHPITTQARERRACTRLSEPPCSRR